MVGEAWAVVLQTPMRGAPLSAEAPPNLLCFSVQWIGYLKPSV